GPHLARSVLTHGEIMRQRRGFRTRLSKGLASTEAQVVHAASASMIPDACPPPTNEAIVAGHTWTVGSGRSRQEAPERNTQRMPFRTRRSSTRGRWPRGLFGSI